MLEVLLEIQHKGLENMWSSPHIPVKYSINSAGIGEVLGSIPFRDGNESLCPMVGINS